jgi:hypothetical protein
MRAHAQGDKPQGTMWESMCANIQIDYNGNQGVFTEIDQCQNQVQPRQLLTAVLAWAARTWHPASFCLIGMI